MTETLYQILSTRNSLVIKQIHLITDLPIIKQRDKAVKNRVDQLITGWIQFVKPKVEAKCEHGEWTIRFVGLLLCKRERGKKFG